MAKKPYNIPAQITEEDRRKAREEIARSERERTSDSDIPASDKMSLEKMLRPRTGRDMLEDASVRNKKVPSREETEALRRETMEQYEKDVGESVGSADSSTGFKRGGLVRGSVRGGGVALRGLGKGKVY